MALLLFGRQTEKKSVHHEDTVMIKLFFDSFSKRVSEVEDGLKALGREFHKVKASTDRSQISDLVLLERLQKAEAVLEESLTWVKRVADSVSVNSGKTVTKPAEEVLEKVGPEPQIEPQTPVLFPRILVPGGEAGSLSSITTPTELQVLALLSEEGAKSAPEVGRVIGRSREHSARLMKKLFEDGYVRRDQTRIPFRYSLVERVRASFKKAEKKDEAREEAAAVPA